MAQYTDWLEQEKYGKATDHKQETTDYDLQIQQAYIGFLEWRNEHAARAANNAAPRGQGNA